MSLRKHWSDRSTSAVVLSASPWIIGILIAVVLAVCVKQLRGPLGGARSFSAFVGYGQPEAWGWFGLFLVLTSAINVGWLDFFSLTGWTPFWLAAGAGFVGALFSFRMLSVIRDVILSIAALVLSFAEVQRFLAAESSATPQLLVGAMFALMLVAYGFGVLLNILRIFSLPKIGQSALGAIDIVLFLMTPFGVSLLQEVPLELQIVAIAIASIAGFGAAIAPKLIIPLAVFAIVLSQAAMEIIVWFDSRGLAKTDWTTCLLLLGLQVGYFLPNALMRRL